MKKLVSLSAILIAATVAAVAYAADEYDVSATAPATAKAKERAVVRVSLRPKAGFHVNVDYPAKLKITTPDGVTVEKAVQTAKEAARFDKDGLDFDVAFVADGAGAKSFTGTLSFAVCTDSSCKPAREPVAFDVSVQ